MDTLYFQLSMLRRQRRLILFTALIMTALGAAYAFLAAPSYTAKALLLTDPKRFQISQPQGLGDAPADPALTDTQVEIIKSEKVLAPVIAELQLTQNPAFNRPGLLASLLGAPAPTEEVATQRVLQSLLNALTVSHVRGTALIEIGFKANDPQLAARVVNAVANAFIVDQLDSKTQAARRASSWLQERIKELGEQATAAEQAVVQFKIANRIVDAGGKLMGDQQVSELNSKLVAARAEISEANAKMTRIQSILESARSTGGVDASTVADTLKSEVVIKLRAKYLELAARAADNSSRVGANHMSVIRIRNQMQDIRNAMTEELQRLAEVYKSDLEIATKKEVETEKALEKAVSRSQETNQAQVKLRELESAAHSYRILYDSFLERHNEQVQQQSTRLSDTRIISPATPPLTPSSPKVMLSVALGAFAGLFLGLAGAILRETTERVFRTADNVEQILGKQCLALVPKVASGPTNAADLPEGAGPHESEAPAAQDGDPAQHSGTLTTGYAEAPGGDFAPERLAAANMSAAAQHAAATSGEAPLDAVPEQSALRLISSLRGPETAVVESPFSRFAEAIQSIKLAADLSGVRNNCKIIGVTSTLANEGKSTIAVNLARMIAQIGAPVVLIDCDLRIHGLSGVLAPQAQAGVVEAALGTVALEDALWDDPLTAMRFLPSQSGSSPMHPAEFLSSNRMARLFETLRQSFEWVIVDLPPVGIVIDAQSLAHLLDFYVYVVAWGETKSTAVKRSLASARDIDNRLLGVALNKVDVTRIGEYDAHYLDYGHRYYSDETVAPNASGVERYFRTGVEKARAMKLPF